MPARLTSLLGISALLLCACQRDLRLARECYRIGDLERSQKLFESAIDQDPLSFDARYGYAVVLQDLSLRKTQPPAKVPGYDPERLLGEGAYGEVWVATERNTGRKVAVKFYTRRGGLDWSLLKREVEKLAFLSADRYVIQLIEVGWDSDPPYYVMEYLGHGSLEERLNEQGALPTDEAIGLFREVATGLMHAHGKGVLHCDLKPANVLVSDDGQPMLFCLLQVLPDDHEERRLTGRRSESEPSASTSMSAWSRIAVRLLCGCCKRRIV